MKKLYIGIMCIGMVCMGLCGCGKKSTETVSSAPIAFSETEAAILVNGEPITVGQIQAEARRMLQQAAPSTPDERAALEQQAINFAIEGLITRQLVRDQMEKSDVVVTDAEVAEAKRVLNDGILGGGTLEELVAQSGMRMEDFEANLRLDIYKNKILKDRTAAAVITDEDVRAYYDKNLTAEFTTPAGRMVSAIVFRVDPAAANSVRDARKKELTDLRKQIQEGADFSEMAMMFSEHPSRINGGEMGIVPPPPEGVSAPFQETVYAQPIGEISEVMTIPDGYQILWVKEERPEEVIAFDDIQLRLKSLLSSQAKQGVAREYLQGLKDTADIQFVGPLSPTNEIEEAVSGDAP